MRCLLRICVFLVAGAIVNVAVAAACAMWIDPWNPDKNDFETARQVLSENGKEIRWVVVRRARAGAVVIESVFTQNPWDENGKKPEALLPAWLNVTRPAPELWHTKMSGRRFEARGWPLLAMWCEVESVSSEAPEQTPVGGYTLPLQPWGIGDFERIRVMPLRPIWLGFAINTLCYAVVLWLLLGAPFAFRRWRRGEAHATIKPA